MMTLKSAERVHSAYVKLVYEVKHSTPGRDGTTLTGDLTMDVEPGSCSVKLSLCPCDAATPKEALDKLTSWLVRMQEAIQKRQEHLLPL